MKHAAMAVMSVLDPSCPQVHHRQEWDCVVSFTTSANPCGPVAVEVMTSTTAQPREAQLDPH